MLATTENHHVKDLLWCKIQITIWEQIYFAKDSRLFAEIRIKRENEALCYIELSVDCKTIDKTQISEKAFDALSTGQPSAKTSSVEMYGIIQHIPEPMEGLW